MTPLLMYRFLYILIYIRNHIHLFGARVVDKSKGQGVKQKPEQKPGSSLTIRGRVVAAREQQLARQGKPNAQLSTREIDKHVAPDSAGEQVLKQAISRLGLSARGYHRVLKVARTNADFGGLEAVTASHVAEVVQYRRLEKV